MASGDDIDKRKVAGVIAVSLDWCWDRFEREFSDTEKAWCRSVFAEFTKKGDTLPKQLKEESE